MVQESKWREFFDAHAPYYLQNEFTENTIAEVDFILEELKVRDGAPLIDIGCGVGRHAIELAKRGYAVTGIDLSEGMLAQAREAAKEAGVSVTWIQADATRFTTERHFDGALCLCEGAFGLLSAAHDPYTQGIEILERIYAALNPGGRLILNALNGYRNARRFTEEDIDKGVFDPLTQAELLVYSPDGKSEPMTVGWERAYMPSELILMLRQAGFREEHLWGGTASNWRRKRPLLDEYEIMAIACKPD